MYLLCEAQGAPVQLRVTVQTEKNAKTKVYTVQPLSAQEMANGKEYRQKRMHFGGAGRRFRLLIESAPASPPWRLSGGITVVSELDPD